MRGKRFRAFAVLLVAGILLFTPRSVSATAIAFSEITFSNLEISPAAGAVQLLGPWRVQAFTQAQNSRGELAPVFDPDLDGDGMVNADAMVTFAKGHGEASAPAVPPNLNVTGSANSSVNIPGTTVAQASSVGRATLFNSFTITGGTGDVQGDFSADISGLLNVFTDRFGVKAETETTFTLELDGTPVLFRHDPLSVGPNSSRSLPFSESLFATRTLQFDTPYFLLAEVDSESSATNIPEPGTLVLLLTGAGVLAGYARRRTL